MSKCWAVNVPKISKAVFFLLQKYHRTHGLCVVGWPRSTGRWYFSFFSDAVRDEVGRARHVASSKPYSLTIYQDRPGLAGWSVEGHQPCPGWDQREVRSRELLAWYEARLSLRSFFENCAESIARWRQTYTVEDAERYLLTWNVMGLFVAARPDGVSTYGRCPDNYGPRFEEWPEGLDPTRADERIHFCDDFVFHTHGRVLVDREAGEIVDLWDAYVRGTNPEAMAHALVERAGGPRPLGTDG
jgi:hypothetical protein